MDKSEKNIYDYLFFQEGPGVRNYQYTTSGVKLLNVSNLVDGNLDLSNSNRYISNEEANGKYKHFLCDVGDLIIASSGIKADYFDKKMGFVKEEMLPLCMNTSTIRFKPLNESDMNIKYFMYYLKSSHFRKQLEYNLTGSAQLNFGPSHLKKMKFIYHDISKQKEIVKKLDFISNMINLKKEQLLNFDVLIKSQFVEMFGTPLVNEKNYNVENAEKICLKITDGSHYSPIDQGTGYPMLSVKDMRNDGFHYDSCKYISIEDYNKMQKLDCIPKKNDVLIAKDGSYFYYGFVVEEEKEEAILSSIAMLRPDTKIVNPFYLRYYMMSSEIMDLVSKNYVTGAALKRVILKGIKQIPVMIPNIDDQNKFAKIVEQIDKQKFEFEKSLQKLEELKASLMQEYFG